ncbi:MAG TPA: hypothetical protein VFK05_28320 [Polyangiaceae bacterium]|nr:hypothetical protein [Polyangiaceae bacterium]
MKELVLPQSPGGATSNGTRAEGDVAAGVFERFDRGATPNEVVIELVLAPDTVENLWRTWARLRGATLLSPEAVRAMREALLANQPIRSGADAASAVRRFIERPIKQCTHCKARFPEYCTKCPALEAHKARKRTRGTRDKRNESRPPDFENELLEAALNEATTRRRDPLG